MASTIQPISPAEHKDVKINTQAGFGHLVNTHLTPVTIHEIADIAANFPIVFVKDGANGRMRMVALFGLAPGENLYIRDGNWLASYVPNHVSCLPFIPVALDNPGEFAICIDPESELVGDEGERLFNDDGTEAEIMGRVRGALEKLIDQEGVTQAFAETLVELGLLKEIAIQLTDPQDQTRELNGVYTINSQRLHELNADSLKLLHDRGFLGGTYGVNHSFAQLKRLLQMRNERGENPVKRVNVRDVEAGQA